MKKRFIDKITPDEKSYLLSNTIMDIERHELYTDIIIGISYRSLDIDLCVNSRPSGSGSGFFTINRSYTLVYNGDVLLDSTDYYCVLDEYIRILLTKVKINGRLIKILTD